ncbi:MAG: single-stranded-DNA-specific exonuclease RecJ [Candidatus Daviesbacteria bacterium]
MAKVWQINNQKIILTSEELLEQLLLNRGLKTKNQREKFLNPKLEEFESDLNLAGITTAKKRILEAIKKQELIIIYGDYDADGLCGAAILYHGLTSLGGKVLPYIPHRDEEGYGLSSEGLKFAKEQGASLIVTVDNGIVALKQAKEAKKLGFDLIITDHHVPLDKKPECLAIVHATNLCGAAVAWCLIRKIIPEKRSEELLDLVALATICDLISLTGVNRSLVKLGLKKLNSTKRPGLLALIKQSSLQLGGIDAYQVGHILGPRLNAKGRLEHAMDGLRLLCTKDLNKAFNLARMLGEANDQRKQLVTEAVLKAREIIEVKGKKIIIIDSEKWIPGIVGLVAGRLKEEYDLPAIVISRGEVFSKGSARSINGINIIETIRQFSGILVDVGGHPQAAGFTIETSKIEIFKEKLEKALEKVEILEDNNLEIEAILDPKKIAKNWVNKISDFEPFGVGNQKPILASFNTKITDIRTVGAEQHLKFRVIDPELGRRTDGIEAIAFGFGSWKNLLQEGQLINLAYYLEIDKFNGDEKLQLKIIDIQLP